MRLEWKKTERGFNRAEFKDANGKDCSIQESSNANEPNLWLGTNENRMELTVPMALILSDELRKWARENL